MSEAFKNETARSIAYQPEVDGLRALAVLAVIAYHFFPGKLSGGFLGVDIFFVISGYLVTGIIISDLFKNNFSFLRFYQKRIIRLFPALVLVLVVVFFAGLLLLTDSEILHLARHYLYTMVYGTNFILYKESGYFDSGSEFKPILHLWSLSIEEQFYLVWPLFLWLLRKQSSKVIFLSICMLTGLSFIYWVASMTNDTAYAFYMPVARLWQLSIGGIAYIAKKNYNSDVITKTLSSTGLNKYINNFFVLELLCAFAIIYFFRTANGYEKQFMPAIFVAAYIAVVLFLGFSSFTKSILSNKFLVYMGLISYPLYLWHWPLISYANIYYTKEVPIELRFFLLIVSVILAYLTYELIEKKIKIFTVPLAKKASILFFAFILICSAGFLVQRYEGFQWRYPSIKQFITSSKAFVEPAKGQPNSCDKLAFKTELCAIQKVDRPPTILLIGDSHAHHFFLGYLDFFKDTEENVLLLAKNGTPPLIGVTSLRKVKTSLDDVFQFLQSSKNVKEVYLGGFWNSYITDEGVFFDRSFYKNKIQLDSNNELNQFETFAKGLDNTFQWANQHRIKMSFILDTPHIVSHLSACWPRPLNDKTKNCARSYVQVLKEHKVFRDLVLEKAEKYNVKIIDPLQYLCSGDICSIKEAGNSLYSDSHHLSVHGSIVLAHKILK